MRRFRDSANDCLERCESSCVRTVCRDSKASRSLHRRRQEGAKHCLDGCLEVFRGVPYSVGLFLPARYLTFPSNLIVASLYKVGHFRPLSVSKCPTLLDWSVENVPLSFTEV